MSNIESLTQAYELSPDNIPLLKMLVSALNEENQHKKALKFIENEKMCAERLIMSAEIYLELEQAEEGIKAYHSAIDLDISLENPELKSSLLAISEKQSEAIAKETSNVTAFKVIDGGNKTDNQQNNENTWEDDLIEKPEEIINFSDVGGLSEVKKQINRKIIMPFQKPSLFQKFKKKSGGGVLLYGPPGCGKTLLARATAGECDANFINISITDVLSRWMGESEARMNAIFELARRKKPCIIFFDELEGLAGKRQYDTGSSMSTVISQFLTEMDGFQANNEGVLVIGATNVPWAVDPAFRRPGRFDRTFFVPPPDREARVAILDLLLSDRPTSNNIDLMDTAKNTSGYSGADLMNLIETSCDIAIENILDGGKTHEINMSHIREAFTEIKSTTTEWLTTAHNYARYSNEGGQYDDVLDFIKKHGK